MCERIGIGGLLFAHGTVMPRIGRRPKGVRKGRLGQCYANAMRLSWSDHGLIYSEGYAVSEHGIIPLLHGWCVDPVTLEVIDPTWDDGLAYYGFAYQKTFAMKCACESECYGIIDTINLTIGGWLSDMATGRMPVRDWLHPVTHKIKGVA